MKTNITILGISLIILSIGLSCNSEKKQSKNINVEVKESNIVKTKKINTNAEKPEKLLTSFVCFVNNSYMGKEQIPVEVDGKTYYGCCEGCVDKLKQNIGNIRFAVDPLTGKQVDKAIAYIVLKPNGNGEVFYFESKDNYLKYF